MLSLSSFFSEDRQEQKEQLGHLLASASARLKQSVCGADSLPPAQGSQLTPWNKVWQCYKAMFRPNCAHNGFVSI